MAIEIRVEADELKSFTEKIFVQVGLPDEDAIVESEVLVWANLRGVDSHGVLRVPQYVKAVDDGYMNPTPDIRILNETPATVMYDADRAFGPVVTTRVMRHVIEKAKNSGVGWGLLRDTTHQGAMAYYSLMAAEAEMAGIAIVCSPPNMAIHGSRAPGAHNSPISIAVPAKSRPPLVLDMATSVAAGGKISLAVDKEVPIPIEWALDPDGNPTTDPNVATILLPAGGPKGSGLALLFECLTGIMAGNPMLAPNLGAGHERRFIQNSIVVAVDIAAFTDIVDYQNNVDDLVDGLKRLPRADGIDEILVPGEPESQVLEERSRDGIPLPAGTINNLEEVASRFGVRMPNLL